MRKVTGTALQVITNTEAIITERRLAIENTTCASDDVHTLHSNDTDCTPTLTYNEFEKLYMSGNITRHQLRTGNFDRSMLSSEGVRLEDATTDESVSDVVMNGDAIGTSRYSRDFEVAMPKHSYTTTKKVYHRVDSTEDDVSRCYLLWWKYGRNYHKLILLLYNIIMYNINYIITCMYIICSSRVFLLLACLFYW